MKNSYLCCYKKNIPVTKRGGAQQCSVTSLSERIWKPFPAPTPECQGMGMQVPG